MALLRLRRVKRDDIFSCVINRRIVKEKDEEEGEMGENLCKQHDDFVSERR